MDNLYKGDDNTALRFFYEPVRNNFQSEKIGRPMFDTVLYVEVLTPGNNTDIPRFEVERKYCEEAGGLVQTSPKFEQYRSAVEAFKRQEGDAAYGGTPISQWPQIDVGLAATLKAAGVFSVEGLAEVSDSALHNLGIGGRTLREQAKAFLTSRQFGLPSAAAAAELSNTKAELECTQAELAELRAAFNATQLQAAKSKVPEPSSVPATGPAPLKGNKALI